MTKAASGGRAIQRAATRVKPEQASTVKWRTPTLHCEGEGRVDREAIDACTCLVRRGIGVRHVERGIRVIAGRRGGNRHKIAVFAVQIPRPRGPGASVHDFGPTRCWRFRPPPNWWGKIAQLALGGDFFRPFFLTFMSVGLAQTFIISASLCERMAIRRCFSLCL